MDSERAAASARSNALHPSHQLQVKHEGRRPLFSAAGGRDENSREDGTARPATSQFGSHGANDRFGLGRRMKPDPSAALSERRSSNGSVPSPSGTRIPRPSSETTTRRKPMSLTEAYRMAQGEEMELSDGNLPADGSPSPAPRPLRARNASDDAKLRNLLSEDHLDSKGRNRQSPLRRTSPLAPKTGTRAGEAGRQLARVTGNEGPTQDKLADWRNKGRTSAEWAKRTDASKLPDLVPGIEDVPLPSVETSGWGQDGTPRSAFPNESPNKTFTWQVDEDFTAGDLQVSDSPRIRVGNRPFASRPSLLDDNTRARINYQLGGRGNSKLDEIRAREKQLDFDDVPVNNIPVQQPRPRAPNTKLDEIRAREQQAEYEIPILERNQPRPKNTKLDEIQRLEKEGISKRAVAAAKLEEIREHNSMSLSPESRPRTSRELVREPFSAANRAARLQEIRDQTISRSLSPEKSRPRTSRESGAEPLSAVNRATRLPVRPRSAFETGGERIPDTPVTIFKNRDHRLGREDVLGGLQLGPLGRPGDTGSAQPGTEHTRVDSRDLLQRLARAASSSPAHEAAARKPPSPAKVEKNVDDKPSSSRLAAGRAANNGRRTTSREDRENQNTRPTVGFTGLRRTRSTESTKSKRSSMHSETDPTDRIEAEMKLFAPMDNYSERGSVRAPSPLTDSDDDEIKMTEATPRAQKPDPLTMPTPRVTGAYVETPATVKLERIEDSEDEPRVEQIRPENPAIFLDKKRSLARNKDQDTASDPGAEEKEEALTTSAAVRRRPRARSLPRRRPPLKNSAKPHSVKDDLLELQRAHNIDDSTLDDLEDILTGRKTSLPKLEEILKELPARPSGKGPEPELKPMPKHATVEDNQKKSQGKEVKKEETTSKGKEVKKEDTTSDGELAAYDRMTKSLRTGLLGIRSAKKGIERLEGHLSTSESKSSTETAKSGDHKHHHHDHKSQCPDCVARPNPLAVAYIHLPIPRLFHRTPQFRFTWLGLVLFVASIWYAAEAGMCQMYCRPSACTVTPCVWSFDDPTFGVALPVKIDQWTTGGYGRTLAAQALEEVQDWVADVQDLAYGREITDVRVESLSFDQKRRHRRRLSKKGLLKASPAAPPEEQAKWDAWRRTRQARERAKEARDMGYAPGPYDDEEGVIGRDERRW